MTILGLWAGAAPACDDGTHDDGNDGSGGDSGAGSESAGQGGQESQGEAGGAAAGAGAGAPSSPCQADPDPTPALLPTSELDADLLARAAAVLGSCWPDDGVDRNLSYLWQANQAARRLYFLAGVQAECLAQADCGCEALSHCLGYEVKTGVDPSCTPSCDGDVMTACGDDFDIEPGYALQIDCGKFGLTCDPVHLCIDAGSTPCEDSDEAQCRDGERPLICGGGVTQQGPDCDALNLGCLDGRCQGTGATCTNQVFTEPELVSYEGVSCSGGVLAACVYGQLESVDCTTLGPGFDCQSLGGNIFCGLGSECLPAGDGATSATDPPSCDGTSLTFCNAGRLDTIDCTSLGFTGCTIDHSQSMYGCTPTLAP